MKRLSAFAAAAAALAVAALWTGCKGSPAAERTSPTALVDIVLIDGTGAPPVQDAVILIRDGVIQAAGPAAAIPTDGCTRVSLGGAYVLPGFFNAHVHSAYNVGNLHEWLSSGVTTIRDLGYTDNLGLVSQREAFNRDPLSARMIASTPIITTVGGYGAAYVSGVGGARAAVQKYARAGFDLIKIALEDDLQGRRWPMLSAAETKAIVETAHAAGKRVTAHVTHTRNLGRAVDAGVDDIAHMVVEPLSDEQARHIASKGITWEPTLELWDGVSKEYSLDWLDVAVRNTGVFFRAGGKIVLGTDYNGYTSHFDPGFPITEAHLLMRAGLSAMDVIVAGTRNAAEACGRADQLGTVAKGKAADLLVVKGNPLDDVNSLGQPLQVYKAGRPVLPGPGASGGDSGAAGGDGAAAAGTLSANLAAFDTTIPRLMREQAVAGLSVAITDASGTLWSRAYGRTDFGRGRAVDSGTIFSFLPGSCALTATAVLMAARDGLVDLDAPIASYIPGFRINSVFQEHPEQLITLRQLLNHTAGLAGEAPAGNNYGAEPVSFQEHINSISSTWLRYPVGANTAYSNLGIDLAAYIVQVRSGMPFAQYLAERVFSPLGMTRAFADPQAILGDTNRAVGHAQFRRSIPPIIPMMGAGGVYASADDLVKFVRFNLNRGVVGGQRVLDGKWLDAMYTPAPGTGGNGLGIFKGLYGFQGHNPAAELVIGGGGFGFVATVAWFPKLGIGGVAVANTGDGSIAVDVLNQVMGAVADDPQSVYHARLSALPANDPDAALAPADPGQPDPAGALVARNRLRLTALAPAPQWREALASYVGDYVFGAWGKPAAFAKVRRVGDALDLDGQRLYETSPGLFFKPDGETVDFRGPAPMLQNIPMKRWAVPAWQWGLVVGGAAAFFLAVLSAPVIALVGSRQRGGSAGRAAAKARSLPLRWSLIGAVVLFVAAGALVAFALSKFPYLMGYGMPAWTPGVPFMTGILTLLPDLAALLALVMAACAAVAWGRRLWTVAARVQCTVMASGALLVTAALAAWRLLGVS